MQWNVTLSQTPGYSHELDGCQGFHYVVGFSTYYMHKTQPKPQRNNASVWRLAYILLGNITKTNEVGVLPDSAQSAHEPLINSHDEIVMHTPRVPPLVFCNWFDIHHACADIKHQQIYSRWLLGPLIPALCGDCRSTAEPTETYKPQRRYLSGMLFKTNGAHRLLPLLLLSVFFFSPANLSFFFHSDAKVTALCFHLPSLSIAVAAVADSCVTQAPEKPDSPTRKVEAPVPVPDPPPAESCPSGSSVLLPACNGGLQVTYLSTPLWDLTFR